MLRECVVLVSVCVFGVGSFTGRGFFCRDPETGKLHPANSTWAASSFCGKYHCKLKRKNITTFEYAPQRQINITTIRLLGDNLTIVDYINNSKKTQSSNRDNDTLKEIQAIKLIDDIDDKNASDKDRYLTAKEIKSLTEILHTVKKSDLDTLVEIYNLAQHIYKGLDKTSTDHVLQETMSTGKILGKEINKADRFKKVTKHDHASYWYEPLANSKNSRVNDLVRPEVVRTDINLEIPAIAIGMLPAAGMLNMSPQQTKSTIVPPMYPPLPVIRKLSDPVFNAALTHKDFRKLPYYYSLSNFQRQSSYKHEPKKTLTAKAGTLALTTTPASTPAPVTTPTTVRNTAYNPIMNKLLHASSKYQKERSPSVFLPYPFTNIQHYNWSFPQSFYHEKLFGKLDYRKKDDTNNDNTIKTRVDKQGNAVLINPDLENFQDLQIRASMIEENVANTNKKQDELRRQVERRKPDWQTDSLPQEILEEIRAHIQEKQRLFINPVSLRKKVKLERVVKLVNLDQVLRSKRSAKRTSSVVQEPVTSELYELYIERTTCNADYLIPGYFRYGNLSQPYPACCPQRIPGR